MSASKIALYIGVPRTTVLRRLEQLIAAGVLERRGRLFYVSDIRAKNIPAEYCERASRLIVEAANELRKP